MSSHTMTSRKLRHVALVIGVVLGGCSSISTTPVGPKQTKVSFALAKDVGVTIYDEGVGCTGKSYPKMSYDGSQNTGDIYVDGASYLSFSIAVGALAATGTGLGYSTQWVTYTIPPGTGDLRIRARREGDLPVHFWTQVERKQIDGQWTREVTVVQRQPRIPMLGTGDWCAPNPAILKKGVSG